VSGALVDSVTVNVQEQLLREKIDPGLTDNVLGEVCTAALGEEVAVRGFDILTGGCWNRVVAVVADGRDLVLKISPHAADRKIIREFHVLKEFRRQTDLPVPEPLLLDETGKYTPGTLLVMKRIPGVVLHQCYGRLSNGDRSRITVEIAEHLAALHDITSIGFGGVELSPEKRHERWADFWLPRFDAVLNDVAGIMPAYLLDRARAVRPAFAAALDIGRRSTMTHYDVWSGNVMVDLESRPPRVSGYIDIPGFFADYARELSFAMMFGLADATFFKTYRKRHDLDGTLELRMSIYNLKMNIRHMQMYPSEYYYEQGATECLSVIERTIG
jgi:aminoglycoside phosphotransferase (APT) family kinase protein